MANNQFKSFDIDEDDYKTFIQNLREALSQSKSHGIFVLMPESEPLSWMDVRLITGNHSITLRIEQRNLYVRGYSRNLDTRFWEFSDTQLIPNSQRLQYSGSYAKADGFPISREGLPLGSENLRNAIIKLADMENPNSNTGQSARQLLIMIQMFAEATRIELIAAHIAANWSKSPTLTTKMLNLQNAWGTFSSAVQRADNTTGLPSTPLPPDIPNPNAFQIYTVGQAAAVFAILLHHKITRVIRAVTLPSLIRTLVSIEYVRVKTIDGGSSRRLYGIVKVEDCWGSHTVYERSSSNTESKGPGDYVTLTGPSAAISGEDAFTISVSLLDYGTNDEIAKGDIVWDPRSDSSYDTPLSADVPGKHGSVTVGYSVIREALSATVSVKITGRGANLYGTIKASSQFQSSTTLFDKSRNESVQVIPQSPIPLTRAVVPAPVNSLSTIALDLWDNASSSGNQIAKGSVQFTPKVGTQDMNISAGTYGQVNVSITCG